MDLLSSNKLLLRAQLRELRSQIPQTRREEAAADLLAKIKMRPPVPTLSFSTIGSEIDLSTINTFLAEKKCLLLPKVEGIHLVPYFGEEPFPLEKIGCILVPALGFDRNLGRLGYGKGYYDRFLEMLLKKNLFPLKIGVGFREQLVDQPVGTHYYDQPLDMLLLT